MFAPTTVVVLAAIFGCFAAVNASHPFDTRKVDPSIFNRATNVNYRLPNHTHPETYDIQLITRVDRSDFAFNGFVRIGIVVDQATNEIVLHTRQLVISGVKLVKMTGNVALEVRLQPYQFDVVPEFLKIRTDGQILNAEDRLILEINYSGTLRTDDAGFYRSSYINSEGSRTWLATTQFESTDARHAFPCYDEPALKAKFKIQITHGKRFTAISNMPETRIENSDDTAITIFEETPLTSSYLIAFIVSDFQFTSNKNNPSALPHRVYTHRAEIGNTALALKDGERVLGAIENYLKVKFTLPKMDQVAVPDFAAGAMENWGLVTYREDALLWNETLHPYSRKTRIVTIIAHEFGHQWFGNIVAPAWWNFLWLNEGFANLFEHIGTDLVYPEWNVFDYYVVNRLQGVLKFDSTPATRPMTFYVESPGDISKLFDNIAYPKSGSVLRMFLHAFTEESFRKGLTYYLTKNSFKAATENDLFEALDRAVKEDKTLDSNLNVKTIFSSWSNQKGYPLLTVTRNYEKGTVTLQQARHTSNQTAAASSSTSWWIPYNYASATNPNFNVTAPNGWLSGGIQSTEVDTKWSSKDWVVFNKQQTSYYRVLYDEQNYKLIIKQLNTDNFTIIHRLSRSQLIDDALDFADQGFIKADTIFGLLGYLKREVEYAPWQSASNGFAKLNQLLPASKDYQKYRQFVAGLTEKAFDKYGVEDLPSEPHFDKYTRDIVGRLACEYGVKKCLNDTHFKLKQVLTYGQKLPPNTKYLVYNNGIRLASEEEVKQLWTRFTQTTDSYERLAIASSFGYSQNETILDIYLNRTIVDYTTIQFSGTERWAVFNSVFRNGQSGLSLAIRLVKNHPAEVKKYLGNLNSIVNRLASRIVSHSVHHQFDDLVKSLRTADLLQESTVTIANNAINANFNWLSAHQKPIENYFHNPNKDAGSSATLMVSSMALIIFAVSYSIFY